MYALNENHVTRDVIRSKTGEKEISLSRGRSYWKVLSCLLSSFAGTLFDSVRLSLSKVFR